MFRILWSPGWDVSYSAINCLTPIGSQKIQCLKQKTSVIYLTRSIEYRCCPLTYLYQRNFAVNFTSRNSEKVPSEQILWQPLVVMPQWLQVARTRPGPNLVRQKLNLLSSSFSTLHPIPHAPHRSSILMGSMIMSGMKDPRKIFVNIEIFSRQSFISQICCQVPAVPV